MKNCWSLRLSKRASSGEHKSLTMGLLCDLVAWWPQRHKDAKSLILFCSLSISFFSYGQFSPPEEPPAFLLANEEPYLFPINPGTQNWLAGTMGELRNTHFHAGIDIRTNNMAGIPVRATQRGYISRVMVGTYGYGYVLF